MPFYKFSTDPTKDDLIHHKPDLYLGLYVANFVYFKNKKDKDAFLNKNKDLQYNLTLKKVDSLLFLLSYAYFDLPFAGLGEESRKIIDIHNDFILVFGQELLNKEFPDELFNYDMINSVMLMADEMHDEMMDKWASLPPEDYPEDNSVNDLYDETTRNWDEETGGSWRDANDFG